jgi:hypothetical protein
MFDDGSMLVGPFSNKPIRERIEAMVTYVNGYAMHRYVYVEVHGPAVGWDGKLVKSYKVVAEDEPTLKSLVFGTDEPELFGRLICIARFIHENEVMWHGK